MDEEHQYPTEKTSRQARKGWGMKLWISAGICLGIIFLNLSLTQAGETGRISEQKKVAPISSDEIMEHLEKVRFAGVKFGNTPVSVLMDFIRDECRRQDPWFKQVGFENRIPESAEGKKQGEGVNANTLSLNVKDVPAYDVLRLVASLHGGIVEIYNGTIYMLPANETMKPMIEKIFDKVPKISFKDISSSTSEDWIDVKVKLADRGMKFYKGASALYNPTRSELKVTNTQDQLDYLTGLLKTDQPEKP